MKVRGLPETVEPEQILPTVAGLFNHLLDKPPQTAINMEYTVYTGLSDHEAETQTHRGTSCAA